MSRELRNQVADAALQNMLSTLPPEVAELLAKKYAEEREKFVQYVTAASAGKAPSDWAKPSCKKCHGRGIIGFVKESGVTCTCVVKNYDRWLIVIRHEFNSKREGMNDDKT